MTGPTAVQVPDTACPGCGTAMRALTFARALHGDTAVDLCGACHALWFDAFESVSLAPEAMLALIREVNRAARAPRALPASLRCPRCRTTLAATQDLRHATRFTYWRCPKGHGRFTPFLQFLREKDFVRPLTPAELARLRAHVAQVRCSGCGAPVDLARDMACSFCRAPLEVLDPDAVAKAVESLERAITRRETVDVDALAGALAANQRAAPHASVAYDLIGAGVALVLSALDR